ncbi:MAG: hypothetical protein JNK92_04230 [Dechloromonas sp.]|nr:hypothetical protein [Dechloromonas sp.]
MSSTPGEFHRALSNAFGDAVTEDATGLLVTEDGGVSLHFALISETPQRVGALQLCALRTEITVRQGDEEAASELLARVDRATQRGGG